MPDWDRRSLVEREFDRRQHRPTSASFWRRPFPQGAEAFAHLGFPAYFRAELSWAKLLGVAVLLAPVPARLNDRAYAGFAIDLASALIAPCDRYSRDRPLGTWPGCGYFQEHPELSIVCVY